MDEKKRTAPGAGPDEGTGTPARTSCPIEITCPRCGLVSPVTAIRCPRCNALLLTSCGGGCATCGNWACMHEG